QQACLPEAHGPAPHAICPGPPSVPRGGTVTPPPPRPASRSTLASSPVGEPLSSPVGAVASSPTPELLPVPELPPVPELLPAPELPFPPPLSSPESDPIDPLHPIMTAIEAPRNVRKADIEVPPRTYFAVSSGPQCPVGAERLHKCDACNRA